MNFHKLKKIPELKIHIKNSILTKLKKKNSSNMEKDPSKLDSIEFINIFKQIKNETEQKK